jgi:uncharacterized protein YfaS (alpha-2-macroglobulin family)
VGTKVGAFNLCLNGSDKEAVRRIDIAVSVDQHVSSRGSGVEVPAVIQLRLAGIFEEL